MSGNRWSARLKGPRTAPGNDDGGFDRAIDGDVGKFDRPMPAASGRRGAIAADGQQSAEIVGPVVGGMVWVRFANPVRRFAATRSPARSGPSRQARERDQRPWQKLMASATSREP